MNSPVTRFSRYFAGICAVVGLSASAEGPDMISIPVDDQYYYLHKVNYHDMSAEELSPAKHWYSQTMVADDNYIYIADHVDNTDRQLVIKRYYAADCTPAPDLRVNENDLYNYYFDLFSDEERCFYLVDCNENDYLILFLNAPADGIEKTDKFKLYFYLIDKDGNIVREYVIDKLPGNDFPQKCISDFGIPDIIGTPVDGNFEMFLPMDDYYGNLLVARYVFVNSYLDSYSTVFYDESVSYCKTSIKVVDNRCFILDDYRISPTLYSYQYINQSYGTLDNHVKAQGCYSFEYDGHRMLYTGDIYQLDGNLTNAVTQLNLSLWDDNSSMRSRSNSTVATAGASFDNVKPFATLQFGKSTVSANQPFPYAYYQHMALTEYSESLKHLHFYVPGEFLATYQLSKSGNVTDIANIDCVDNILPAYIIRDGILEFDSPVEHLHICNIAGTTVYSSTVPVKTVDIRNYSKGIYIINASGHTSKIII